MTNRSQLNESNLLLNNSQKNATRLDFGNSRSAINITIAPSISVTKCISLYSNSERGFFN